MTVRLEFVTSRHELMRAFGASPRRLPREFLEEIRALESSYLASDDPREQSGFGGGPERWKVERGPILEAVQKSGTFLDVGCANGYLLECLVAWAATERGIRLLPFGVDINPGLIAKATKRWPGVADHFWVANAWDFKPPRTFDFVYSLIDNVPEDFVLPYVTRLMDRMVTPGGRLILGAYGSKSRDSAPADVAKLLKRHRFPVIGESEGGTMTRGRGPVTRFAWLAA